MKKIFIVGCPRSGTTLLQSLLGTHPEIATFPETHYFQEIINGGKFNRLGLAGRASYVRYREFTRLLKRNPIELISWPIYITPAQAYRRADVLFQKLSAEQGKSVWLEKTPNHLFCISDIVAHFPNSYFIHLVRNPEDVVASLYEASNKYSENWGGGSQSVEQCCDLWNRSMNESAKYIGKPAHCILNYDDIVSFTSVVLDVLSEFLSVDIGSFDLHKRSQISDQIVNDFESWKDNNFREIKHSDNRKFDLLFEPKQQELIGRSTDNPNYKRLTTYSREMIS